MRQLLIGYWTSHPLLPFPLVPSPLISSPLLSSPLICFALLLLALLWPLLSSPLIRFRLSSSALPSSLLEAPSSSLLPSSDSSHGSFNYDGYVLRQGRVREDKVATCLLRRFDALRRITSSYP